MATVFFDVDTQLDFLLPSGALAVPGAAALLPALAELNRYAATQAIPLISTMDAHAENDPEFAAWPAHCVAGTLGQRKPESTLLPSRLVIPNTAQPLPGPLAPQILLEKTSTNCFTNPNLAPLLARLGARRAVVYGVVAEICVRQAVVGLQQTGLEVHLVTDAVKELSAQKRDEFFAALTAVGGVLTTKARIISGA
jgi:nicotinamidase/pyrazinamidase